VVLSELRASKDTKRYGILERKGGFMTLSPIHIKIKSFQSIEEIEFEVHGFTIISGGRSNAGKSAIIRAISGALINSPVGPLVRKGAKYCSVSMDTDEWGLLWEKGERGINRYHLKGKEKPLDKVGSGQVDEVANFGFGSVKVGPDHIYPWVAPQFEPLFLLNKSGPAITDFISEVSRLQVLQNAILINIKNKKKAQDEIRIRNSNIEQLESKEQLFAKCDSAVSIKNDLEAQVISINEYDTRVAVGDEIDAKLDKINQVIEKVSNIDCVSIPFIEQEPFSSIGEMYGYWVSLEKSAHKIISVRNILSVKVPNLIDHDIIKSIVAVDKLSDRIGVIEKSVDILSKKIPTLTEEILPPGLKDAEGILIRINTLKTEESTLLGLLDNATSEIKTIDEEMLSIPLCPSCLRPTVGGHSH
jgi:hypothetical protein